MTSSFASLFQASSQQDWLNSVDKVLKGKDFNKTLTRKTDDGLTIQPLYARANPQFLQGRAAQSPWFISQLVDENDNQQALEDLQNGASSLTLVMQGGIGARRGFAINSLENTLKGVFLDLIPLRIDGGSLDIAQQLAQLTKGVKTQIALGLDPISKGETEFDAKPLLAFKDLGTLYMADGRLVSDAGGSEAQELAYVISSGLKYLKALEKAGLSLDEARTKISFLLAADQNQFLTIAKFRALRLLWGRIEEACGLKAQPIDLHAQTAWRMVSIADASVNWLRTTVAVMAAGLGGANHICVLPHTAAIGLATPFARRLARNTQLVLLEESNLHQVSDPASGAGGIETLTDELCEKAWGMFQEIEKNGLNSLKEQIKGVKQARDKAIATRKMPLTGISEFPNINDIEAEVKTKTHTAKPVSLVLESSRFSQIFEELVAKNQGKSIYLCNIGELANFNGRNGFAKNFFEAGGVRTISGDVKEFKASKCEIVCLCAADADYETQAATTIEKLRKNGATKIVIAGKNETLSPLLDGSIFMGIDLVATITSLMA